MKKNNRKKMNRKTIQMDSMESWKKAKKNIELNIKMKSIPLSIISNTIDGFFHFIGETWNASDFLTDISKMYLVDLNQFPLYMILMCCSQTIHTKRKKKKKKTIEKSSRQ